MTEYYVVNPGALSLVDIKRYLNVYLEEYADNKLLVTYTLRIDTNYLLVENLSDKELTLLTLTGTTIIKIIPDMFSHFLHSILTNEKNEYSQFLWNYI